MRQRSCLPGLMVYCCKQSIFFFLKKKIIYWEIFYFECIFFFLTFVNSSFLSAHLPLVAISWISRCHAVSLHLINFYGISSLFNLLSVLGGVAIEMKASVCDHFLLLEYPWLITPPG